METTARRSRPALAALALALPLLAAGAPATAAPNEVVYDALGDSYAAGFATAPAQDFCARSPYAYPEVLDGRMKITLDDAGGFVACQGATIGPNASAPTNVLAAQLWALDAETDLVTLTIGGNDIRWGDVVRACLGGTDLQCDVAIATSTAAIENGLPVLLHGAYSGVAAAAPNAHVVVTGYPRLFSPEYGAFLGASVLEQEALNSAADTLNGVIAQAAAAHDFQFVDVTSRFDGHGVNSPEPLVSPTTFHPTADGQNAYAAAVTAAINPRDLR